MRSPINRLADDLRALGIREGGVLLVHSSLRSLGGVAGGAETVIRALLDVVGAGGTLLLPALSYETVTAERPCFDVRKTPVCVGALPEYFRQRTGTLRSVHPTHSVCGVGAQAGDLLGGHERDTTPCGPNSPFHKLPHYHGQILFLGCGLRPNTSMHALEELSEPAYLFAGEVEYDVIAADGRTSRMRIRRHNFKGWVQRYDRVAQVLDGAALRTGRVLAAGCHLIEAAAMWPAVHEKLKHDPLFFVDREGGE
jgi:aminoglycoside 3-N-acetyltransferase